MIDIPFSRATDTTEKDTTTALVPEEAGHNSSRGSVEHTVDFRNLTRVGRAGT